MTTPEKKPSIKLSMEPQPDLVKHLVAKDGKPGWVLLGIIAVTVGQVLISWRWWLGPCVVAVVGKSYVVAGVSRFLG